jgi:hypothetical protein
MLQRIPERFRKKRLRPHVWGGNESCRGGSKAGAGVSDCTPALSLLYAARVAQTPQNACFLLLAASDESCPLRHARCTLSSASAAPARVVVRLSRRTLVRDSVGRHRPNARALHPALLQRAARLFGLPFVFFFGNQRNISPSNDLSTCPS